MTLGSASDWFLVAFAAATTVSAYRSWKTARELEWLMGALESHSTVRLRILAKDKGLKVVAFDPSHSRFPGSIPIAGDEWQPPDKIFLALPREFRARG